MAKAAPAAAPNPEPQPVEQPAAPAPAPLPAQGGCWIRNPDGTLVPAPQE